MEKIASFTINHLTLKRGIFVSRQDKVGNDTITTFDLRMKEPNREPVMDNAPIHALEHLCATFLRNSGWSDKIIYFGPMGCRTGCYLLLKGDLTSEDILPLIIEMFEFVQAFEGSERDIPGASARDCGNYLDMNLSMAKWEAKHYLDEVLYQAAYENLNYPKD